MGHRRHAGKRVWATSQLEAWELPGLVLHLVGDGSGTTLRDRSGYARHGVMSGSPDWTASREGIEHAVRFDATNDYVDISALPKPTLPITIAFWVRPVDSTPVGIFDSAPSNPNVLRNYPAGQLEWWNNNPRVTMDLTAATWSHVVAIFSFNGNRQIDYFRNGVLYASASGNTDSGFEWTGARLGDINAGGAGRFGGDLADFRVYSARKLTNAEIARLADPARRLTAVGRRSYATAGGGGGGFTAASRRTFSGAAGSRALRGTAA